MAERDVGLDCGLGEVLPVLRVDHTGDLPVAGAPHNHNTGSSCVVITMTTPWGAVSRGHMLRWPFHYRGCGGATERERISRSAVTAAFSLGVRRRVRSRVGRATEAQ